MKEHMSTAARVFVEWDSQIERLEAPPDDEGKRHWLPCDECGDMIAVPWNVVSTLCEPCYHKLLTGGE